MLGVDHSGGPLDERSNFSAGARLNRVSSAAIGPTFAVWGGSTSSIAHILVLI